MEHLACFVPGMLALGAKYMRGNVGECGGVKDGESIAKRHLELAKDMMRTCYEMYARTPTGLGPEGAKFGAHGFEVQHPHSWSLVRSPWF